MANYFILSSGNFRQDIHCISNAVTDVTSSSASFSLPASAIITTSTTGHTSPIRAVALALSARSADPSGEISLKVASPTNTAVYIYAISSLPYYQFTNNLSDSVHQNLTVFNFPQPFQITSGQSLTYELSASRENAVTVVGNVDVNSKLNINRCNIISVPLENNINITTTKSLVSTEDNISRLTFARASSHFFSGTTNSRFNLSNDFTLGIQFSLTTAPTGSLIYGLFSISNTGLTALSGFNVLLDSTTIYVRVNNTIYGRYNHNLGNGSSCTYICTKQGNDLAFFIDGIYQNTVTLTSAASTIPNGNTIYIGSGNNVTQSVAASTTFLNGSISTIVFNSSSCLYNINTLPTNSTELPSPFVPGTVAYISPSASYNFNKLTYSLSASPVVDDVRITTPIYPVTVSLPATSIDVKLQGLVAFGDVYIYNNTKVVYDSNVNNNLYVYGNKGIHINGNSYLNLSAENNKQAAIYLQNGGICVGGGGNLNIIGADKALYKQLAIGAIAPVIPTTLSTGTSSFTGLTEILGDLNDTIIFNLNKFETTNIITTISSYSWSAIDVANSNLSAGYDLRYISLPSSNVFITGQDFFDTNTWGPSGITKNINVTVTRYNPDVVNITRNIKISGINTTSSYIKPYICSFSNSNTNIKNTEILNIGKPYINQTGIINGASNLGSFLLKNSVIRNVLSLPANMPQDINPYAYPQGITTASANLYSLYISPNTTNNFISPDVRNTALTGNYTIDFWTYALGSSNNNNGVIFSWGEVVNSASNPATANFYSKLQLTKSTTNNSLKLSYSDSTTGDYTDIITTNNSIIPGVWYHIAITCSNNIIKLWIDGILMGSGYINSIYPTVYDALSGESTYGNLTIGGDTLNTGYDGYIFDFRINLQQNIEPSPAGLITPLSALTSDYFRLNRTSTLLADSSTFNRSISCNKPLYAKMVNFSPFSQSVNNTTITDNIFVQNTEKNIYLHHTTLNNVTISGNIMLSCANTNIYFDSISAIAVNMNNNFINPPYLSAYPNVILKNCSSIDTTVIGGVVTYNNVISPGITIKGSNQGKIGNILSYNNKNAGILIEPTNNCNKVLFNNITCISNELDGVKFNNILNLPISITGNNVGINNNIESGITVSNLEYISNITLNNNIKNNLLIQNNYTNCNINNININTKSPALISRDTNFWEHLNYWIASSFLQDAIRFKPILNADTFKFNNFTMQYWINPEIQNEFVNTKSNVFLPTGLHSNYFHFGVGRTPATRNRVVFAWWNPSALRFANDASINTAYSSNYSYYVSTDTIPNNVWTHIAVCIDSLGFIRMYINGKQTTKAASVILPSNSWNQVSPDQIKTSIHAVRPAFNYGTRGRASVPNAWNYNPNITNFSIGRFDISNIRAIDGFEISPPSNTQGLVVGGFDQDYISTIDGFQATFKGSISGISVIDNYAYTNNFTPQKTDTEVIRYMPSTARISMIPINNSNIYPLNGVYTNTGAICIDSSDSVAINIENSSLISEYFNASIYFKNTTLTELNINRVTANSIHTNNILMHNVTSSQIDNNYNGSENNLSTYEQLINANININNSKLDNFSVTNLLSNSAIRIPRGIAFTNYDQISGKNITYFSQGTRETNTSPANVGVVASPSEKLTPTSRDIKLNSSSKFVAVPEGMSISEISVYVRKSTVADGAAYNGSAPRLMLKANPSIGIYNDTLLHTVDEPAGSYYKLEGIGLSPAIMYSIYEFYVDCDGTAGWIDVDSWSAT